MCRYIFPIAIFALFIFTFSCSKISSDKPLTTQQGTFTVASNVSYYADGIIDNMPAVNHDNDSIERPTLLGARRTNPYLIANMRQAYLSYDLPSSYAIVTNQYVRFKPSSVDQLAFLDSLMDTKGLELFDTPMDYDVLEEGDYYQDPTIPDDQVTWQYAVVPPTFSFPSGVQYEILAQIHIPNDNYTAIETEAERIAAVQDSLNGGGIKTITSSGTVHPNVTECAAGYYWDDDLKRCIKDNCPSGYHWDVGQNRCIANTSYPTPQPSPDAQTPAGYIRVEDFLPAHTTPYSPSITTIPGVKNIRVVAKRWFKIDRMFTDDNGYFITPRRYKHKVKINIKFKNNFAHIKGIRGVRIWQLVLPIKRTIGVFASNKNAINFTNTRFTGGTQFSSAKGNRFWVAATALNALSEHKTYAISYGFSPAPETLSIYLTNWGRFQGLASTPLFRKRFIQDLPISFVNTFLLERGNITSTTVPKIISALITGGVDMALDYHSSDPDRFNSDWLKENFYHELSHASQYVKAGSSWYANFVQAELNETLAHVINRPDLSPYGDGSNTNSPIIAVGEAWGYHMGLYLADQTFNHFNSGQMQRGDDRKQIQSGGGAFVGSDGDLLENFKPSLTNDPFHWIPKGVFWDMIDVGEPALTTVHDDVRGFTNQQIFSALQSDVMSPLQFRLRFEQQNPANQLAEINALFNSYGPSY